MSRRMSAAVAPRKMAEVFTTAVSRQFLPIGSFSLNYLLDPKSETPPPIGQVRLGMLLRPKQPRREPRWCPGWKTEMLMPAYRRCREGHRRPALPVSQGEAQLHQGRITEARELFE